MTGMWLLLIRERLRSSRAADPVETYRRLAQWPAEEAFYMVCAYTKAEQGDLTPTQTRELSRVVREEFK